MQKELQELLTQYPTRFIEVPENQLQNSNCRREFIGKFVGIECKTITVAITDFGSWFTINTQFGEVRRWINYTMAEFGIAYCSSSEEDEFCRDRSIESAGCALPGYTNHNTSYRVGIKAGKSASGGPFDLYIESSNIIEWLLSCELAAKKAVIHPGDPMATHWNEATIIE